MEHPELDITLIDISLPALKVAQTNAALLHADVKTLKSDLLADYPFTPDIIIANLPYVDMSWERSLETDKEPSLALFAGDNGLAVINRLIVQTKARLHEGGILILEADPSQHQAISKLAHSCGLKTIHQQEYCIAFQKTQ